MDSLFTKGVCILGMYKHWKENPEYLSEYLGTDMLNIIEVPRLGEQNYVTWGRKVFPLTIQHT